MWAFLVEHRFTIAALYLFTVAIVLWAMAGAIHVTRPQRDGGAR